MNVNWSGKVQGPDGEVGGARCSFRKFGARTGSVTLDAEKAAEVRAAEFDFRSCSLELSASIIYIAIGSGHVAIWLAWESSKDRRRFERLLDR